MLAVFLLSLLTWFNGISKTLNLKSECSRMEYILDSTDASNSDIESIRAKIENYNDILGSETEKIEEINRGIMNFIGGQLEPLNLTLTEFPPVHEFVQNQYVIYTHQAEVEGSFANTLKLIYELETKFKLAKICGLKIHTKEDYATHRKKLYALIYVQNIRTKN